MERVLGNHWLFAVIIKIICKEGGNKSNPESVIISYAILGNGHFLSLFFQFVVIHHHAIIPR
jgi:hypothetical protein